MPREFRPAMEAMPFKPSPMDLKEEVKFSMSGIGWEDAPSSRWPVLEASLDVEPNCPISRKKIGLLESAIKRLENARM